MVTIKQVAVHAGVSFKTVSRVVNNDLTVKKDNRERVLSSIKELGYRPNKAAKMTRSKKSGTIGFIADDLLKVPNTIKLIMGAQRVAWDKNIELMVLNVSVDRFNLERAIDQLMGHRVEGIIYATMYHHKVTLPDELMKTPTVLANCSCDNQLFPSIVPDEELAGETAATALIKKGYKRIAFLNLNENIVAARLRKQGVLNAFQKCGLPEENLYVESVHFGPIGHEISRARESVFNVVEHFKPDAILCGKDGIAVDVYFALQSLGLLVGEDIGVASFDEWEEVPLLLQPNLSTMALPLDEMGAWSMNYLLDGRQDNVHEKSPFKMVTRNSF